jgi:hypothetical protein
MMSLGMFREAQPPEVQFTVPIRPRSTPKLVMINPRGNQSNWGLGGAGLHDALRSTHPPPHLPKDNEEVNTHVKRLQVMLDATTVMMKHEVMSLTTGKVLMGTQ